ncbi:MAG: uracil phosphoribosyltransferase [Wenzhouxiangellaceae bacterium]
MAEPAPNPAQPLVTVVDHPLVQHKLSLMRCHQTSTAEFRQLMHEVGLLLGYEALRDLPMATEPIETPMGAMQAPMLSGKKLCLVSILRAGNGFLEPLLQLVPSARVGMIGLFRDEQTLQPQQYYFKVPQDLDQRLVVVLDPMLATGHSAVAAIDQIKKAGAKHLRFICLVAAPEGIETLTKAHPDVPVVVAAIDQQLNEHGYIVPGLGDAGDRLFGTK